MSCAVNSVTNGVMRNKKTKWIYAAGFFCFAHMVSEESAASFAEHLPGGFKVPEGSVAVFQNKGYYYDKVYPAGSYTLWPNDKGYLINIKPTSMSVTNPLCISAEGMTIKIPQVDVHYQLQEETLAKTVRRYGLKFADAVIQKPLKFGVADICKTMSSEALYIGDFEILKQNLTDYLVRYQRAKGTAVTVSSLDILRPEVPDEFVESYARNSKCSDLSERIKDDSLTPWIRNTLAENCINSDEVAKVEEANDDADETSSADRESDIETSEEANAEQVVTGELTEETEQPANAEPCNDDTAQIIIEKARFDCKYAKDRLLRHQAGYESDYNEPSELVFYLNIDEETTAKVAMELQGQAEADQPQSDKPQNSMVDDSGVESADQTPANPSGLQAAKDQPEGMSDDGAGFSFDEVEGTIQEEIDEVGLPSTNDVDDSGVDIDDQSMSQISLSAAEPLPVPESAPLLVALPVAAPAKVSQQPTNDTLADSLADNDSTVTASDHPVISPEVAVEPASKAADTVITVKPVKSAEVKVAPVSSVDTSVAVSDKPVTTTRESEGVAADDNSTLPVNAVPPLLDEAPAVAKVSSADAEFTAEPSALSAASEELKANTKEPFSSDLAANNEAPVNNPMSAVINQAVNEAMEKQHCMDILGIASLEDGKCILTEDSDYAISDEEQPAAAEEDELLNLDASIAQNDEVAQEGVAKPGSPEGLWKRNTSQLYLGG